MSKPKTITVYIVFEGAIWKLGKKALEALVATGYVYPSGDDETFYATIDACLLKSPKKNWQTGVWSNLPKALYQDDPVDGWAGDPWAWKPHTAVVSMDDFNADEAAWYLAGGE